MGEGAEKPIHNPDHASKRYLQPRQKDQLISRLSNWSGPGTNLLKEGHLARVETHEEPPCRTWLTKTSSPLMWISALSSSGWNTPSTT